MVEGKLGECGPQTLLIMQMFEIRGIQVIVLDELYEKASLNNLIIVENHCSIVSSSLLGSSIG